MLDLILLVSDERLEEDDFLLKSRVADRLGYLQGLLEVAILVVTLSQVEFVFGHVRVELGELFVDSCGVEEVLTHVVAVGEERHGATARTELEFITEVVDGLSEGEVRLGTWRL